MADITLAWMMTCLHPFLEFDIEYLRWQQELHTTYYGTLRPPQVPRPWGMGKLYDSSVGVYAMAGIAVRTPRQYVDSDGVTGKPTGRRLKQTNESVHVCVRIRQALGGLGAEDSKRYEPLALKGWRLERGGEGYVWWKKDERGEVLEMKEEGLGDLEISLLERSPGVYKRVMEEK